MQILQTRYNGIVYRSRAEARWAIVFDQLGWTHHYEPEAFRLGSVAYLPDFFLPDVDAFFEVKGTEPSEEARAKATLLCEATERHVVMSVGPPNPGRKEWDEDLITFVPERDDEGVLAFEYRGGFVTRRSHDHPACSISLGNLGYLGSLNEISWLQAFRAAANHRFGVYDTHH